MMEDRLCMMTAQVEAGFKEKVRQQAQKENLSLSALVRKAVEEYLYESNGMTPTKMLDAFKLFLKEYEV